MLVCVCVCSCVCTCTCVCATYMCVCVSLYIIIIINLPEQLCPLTSWYPVGQEQKYPPSMLVQVCSQIPGLTVHSSISK